MRRVIHDSELCANECGRRALPGEHLCRDCYRRSHTSIAVPGRDVAQQPSKSLSVAPRAQNGHSSNTIDHEPELDGRIQDLDYWGAEWYEESDL